MAERSRLGSRKRDQDSSSCFNDAPRGPRHLRAQMLAGTKSYSFLFILRTKTFLPPRFRRPSTSFTSRSSMKSCPTSLQRRRKRLRRRKSSINASSTNGSVASKFPFRRCSSTARLKALSACECLLFYWDIASLKKAF